MTEKRKSLPRDIFLYLLLAVLSVIVISLKVNYYIDEIYSYGLSNYRGDGIDMTVESDLTYAPASSAYSEYMAVQRGERFDYSGVWENQAKDVHPPLYYVILHTICSLFPDTYSKWYAGSINIVFVLLSLFVMRKLIWVLTGNRNVQGVLSFLFVCMPGTLLGVAYLRMYMMAMLWVTLLTYLFVRQVDGEWDIRFYVSVYLVTALGALTHYYVIMYAVLISIVFGIYLLWDKRFKETGAFCLTMALSGASSVIIFPAMKQHIFFGYRGTEAIGRLMTEGEQHADYKGFYDNINLEMFGNMLGYFFVILIILAVVRYAKNHFGVLEKFGEREISFGFERETVIRYVLVLVPCVAYFMLVSKMTFITADRYLFPIYAVAFAGITCMIYTVFRYFFDGKAFFAVAVIMTVLLIGQSYRECKWIYLYRDYVPFLELVEAHGDYDCICVMEEEAYHLLYPEFVEYTSYKSITFISSEEFLENGISRWASPKGVIVSFIGVADLREEDLQKVVQDNGYLRYEYLGAYGFDVTYFMGK